MSVGNRGIETVYLESVGTIVAPEIAGIDFSADSDARTMIVKDYMSTYGEDINHVSAYVIDLLVLDTSVSDVDMARLRAHMQSMERSVELIQQVMQQRREEK